MSVSLSSFSSGSTGTAAAPARENQVPSDRAARVDALRDRVRAGTYRVDPQELATRLLDHPSNPLGLAPRSDA